MALSFMMLLLQSFVNLSIAIEDVPSTSSSPPDLSRVRPIDLLLHNAERKFGNACYIVSYRVCPRGVPALGCMSDDMLEAQTKIKLDQLKFVYQESSFHTHVYRATPRDPKRIKEKDLFNTPVNLFVFLKEIPACSSKSLPLPELPRKESEPSSQDLSFGDQEKQKMTDEELREYYKHFPQEEQEAVIRAHKFLTDVPLSTKN
jgi:hypothetical protein